MFALLSLCFFLSKKVEGRPFYRLAHDWIIPIGISLSMVAFFEEGKEWFQWDKEEVGPAINFILGGLILLIGNKKKPKFLLSQAFYLIGILYSFSFPINDFLRVLIVSGGIAMSYFLYKQMKEKLVTYYVTICTVVSYITLLYSIHESSIFPSWLEEEQWIIGGALLIVVVYGLRKHDEWLSTSFLFTAHVYVPAALLLTFFFFETDGKWSFMIAAFLYGVTVNVINKEWVKRTLLYGCFVSFFIAIRLVFMDQDWTEYSFFVTSILMAIWWWLSPTEWKKRTIDFLVPFSIIGMLSMLTAYPFEHYIYFSLMVYGAGLLFLLHRVKWDFLAIFPLIVILAGNIQLSYVSTLLVPETKTILFTVLGLVFIFTGKRLYKGLLVSNSLLSFRYIDAYTVISLLSIVFLYTIETEGMFFRVLPGILISLFVWMQQTRVSVKLAWIPRFVAGGYLLEPYYQLIGQLSIPILLEREVYVLPIIALVIYLQHCLRGAYSVLIQRIQWLILIGVSLLLVQDGLQSNTVYDAIIVGSLSLVSILAGAMLRIKSYFFVGSGILLLNVVLQTRPYWGNLPWWSYLLLAGSILITVASYNEWNKQKRGKGETIKLEELRKKVILQLKTWK